MLEVNVGMQMWSSILTPIIRKTTNKILVHHKDWRDYGMVEEYTSNQIGLLIVLAILVYYL